MFVEQNPSTNSGNNMIQILTACPLCQAHNNPLKMQVMAEREDAHLLYLECRKCGSAVMAVVTTGTAGMSSVGTITDLTSQEIADFPHRVSVTHDDLLDYYQWMERSQRRVGALLKE